MDKQQIIDYVMHTPENTNPNVLGSMVESLLDENSGYKVETGNLMKTTGQGGTSIATLTKIGPLVICEFNGSNFESDLKVRFPNDSFKPFYKSGKPNSYNSTNLYIKLGYDTLGFGFSQYQNTEEYFLSIKGNSSSYVGKAMTGITVYFANTEESII